MGLHAIGAVTRLPSKTFLVLLRYCATIRRKHVIDSLTVLIVICMGQPALLGKVICSITGTALGLGYEYHSDPKHLV